MWYGVPSCPFGSPARGRPPLLSAVVRRNSPWWRPGACSCRVSRTEEDAMQQRMDRRTVAKGAGTLIGVAAALDLLQQTAQGAEESTPEGAPEQSLYDRVGGIFAIAAVVNRFSDEIITNPKLNENPALKAWNETEAEFR